MIMMAIRDPRTVQEELARSEQRLAELDSEREQVVKDGLDKMQISGV